MKQTLIEQSANVPTKLAIITGAGGSMLGFLNSNAAALGLILSFIFGCIGIYTSWRKNTTYNENSKRLDIVEADNKRLRSENAAISERKQER